MKIRICGDLSPEIPARAMGQVVTVTKFDDKNRAAYFTFDGREYVVWPENYEAIEEHPTTAAVVSCAVSASIPCPSAEAALLTAHDLAVNGGIDHKFIQINLPFERLRYNPLDVLAVIVSNRMTIEQYCEKNRF